MSQDHQGIPEVQDRRERQADLVYQGYQATLAPRVTQVSQDSKVHLVFLV